MSVVQKEVVVVDSVDTVVKSIVDFAHVLKGDGDWKSIIPDLLADVAAVPNLLTDVKESPFESANTLALGLVALAKVLLA